ncbi:uncharacterized protein LOC127734022 isoform X2 [Mytilus californianus]|uniref:uncharacterized protein LOC127734022 isoform X2 n=1 Tax=Mytilus californianus TaxID=6549 RepID=UPI0022476FCC|nr:uncharacterized protein LOC127734022 isoform X2 [Mytilus californianus]
MEKMWIILFVVININSVYTNTVHEFIGSTATFKCPYIQEGSSKVVWKGPYNGQTVYSHSNHRNTYLPSDLYNRLFIISNSSIGRFDLKIVNLQYSDEGEYNCSVLNNGTTNTHSFNLSLPALLESSEPSYYRYLKLDPSAKKLIVGHMNYVSIVDILDIPRFPVNSTPIQFPSEANKLSYCTLSKEKIPYCQNHIRVLEFRTDNIVILCGTNADSPTGFELNITDNSHISLGPVPCANDPFDNFTTTYVRDHNSYGKGTMYYGATLHTEATIFRPIYDKDGTVSSEYQKGVISSNWMKDPQFVGSFSLKESVLFFFRETATEVDPSENKVYSRVAKVCKSDIGGNSILRNKWTSYQKARLQCFTEGNSPVYFDEMQDMVKKDGIFYGLFTTRIKSPVSVICAFTTSDIEAVFNGPFKTQVTQKSFWTEAKNIPQPRPGMCINDSMAQSEDVLNFIANHPLMHESVQPLYGKPIFVLYDHLQKLELHKDMTEIVFYAGSSSGKVYKLFSKNENTYVSNIYSPLPTNEAIWSLVNIGDFVFIGTDYSVRQINVIHCEQYIKIDQCIKDPHCAWIDTVCSKKYISSNPNVHEIQIDDYDNFSLTGRIPYMYRPESPKCLRVINTFETKLLIEWISGFSGDESQVFVLEFRKYDDFHWASVEVNETDKKSDLQSFELTGLTKGKIYNIRICAENSFGKSQLTEILTVSTGYFKDDIMKGLPDRPSQLSVIKVWKTKLLLEWMPGIHVGTYQIFVLKYKLNEGIKWTSVEINQTKMSSDPNNITLTGLTECQIYTLHMYAETGVGKSDTTENITVSTDCSGQPVKPQHLRVIQIFKTKCLIAWIPGSRTNLTFIIKFVKKDHSKWQLLKINQTDTNNVIKTFELTKLNVCEIYTIQMSSANYNGESQPTENITVKTDCPHTSENEGQPVKPQHLRVIQIFKTKCLIAWIPGSRTNLTFIIKFMKKDHSKWQLLKINQTDTNNVIKTFELTNLNECEIYTIQMSSENYNGESQPTENITVTTDCPHTSENEDTRENNLLVAILIVLIFPVVILGFIVYYKCVYKKGYRPEEKTVSELTTMSTEKSGTILLGFNDIKNNHDQEEQEKLLGTKGGSSFSVSISKPGDENSEHTGTADEKHEESLSKTANSQENVTRDQLNETCDQALENQSCSSDNM